MPALVLGAVGCGDGTGAADLATATDDLAVADLGVPADLALLTSCSPSAGQTAMRFVWTAISVPEDHTLLAWDLNGDGRADNQLGNIVEAFEGQLLNPQGEIDRWVDSGLSITLGEERSSDATFTSDVCATTDLMPGLPLAAPDAGAGGYAVDGTVAAGHFFGPIAARRFTSEPTPAYASVPTTVRVPLPMFGAVPADVVGARITYYRAADGTIVGGQLNGAVRKEDIATKLVPGLAARLDQHVRDYPSTTVSFQILAIWDTGGVGAAGCGSTCRNLDGSCAGKGDGRVSDCEVGTSGLILNVLVPDVQLFDDAGSYAPSAANAKKNAMSVGFEFTAAPASF